MSLIKSFDNFYCDVHTVGESAPDANDGIFVIRAKWDGIKGTPQVAFKQQIGGYRWHDLQYDSFYDDYFYTSPGTYAPRGYDVRFRDQAEPFLNFWAGEIFIDSANNACQGNNNLAVKYGFVIQQQTFTTYAANVESARFSLDGGQSWQDGARSDNDFLSNRYIFTYSKFDYRNPPTQILYETTSDIDPIACSGFRNDIFYNIPPAAARWQLKYTGQFSNYYSELIEVNIFEDTNKIIVPEPLQFGDNPVTITKPGIDYYTQIFGTGATIRIMVDPGEFLKYSGMFGTPELRHRVNIINITQNKILFEGFIMPEIYKNNYTVPDTIQLPAYDRLKTMDRVFQNLFPTNYIDGDNTIVLIDLIISLLKQTQVEINELWVNVSLWNALQTESKTASPFETLFINSNSLWRDDYERKSVKDILQDILLSFDARIFQQFGRWYIIRVPDYRPADYVNNGNLIDWVVYDMTDGSKRTEQRPVNTIEILQFLNVVDGSAAVALESGLKRLTIEQSFLPWIDGLYNGWGSLYFYDWTTARENQPLRTWAKYDTNILVDPATESQKIGRSFQLDATFYTEAIDDPQLGVSFFNEVVIDTKPGSGQELTFKFSVDFGENLSNYRDSDQRTAQRMALEFIIPGGDNLFLQYNEKDNFYYFTTQSQQSGHFEAVDFNNLKNDVFEASIKIPMDNMEQYGLFSGRYNYIVYYYPPYLWDDWEKWPVLMGNFKWQNSGSGAISPNIYDGVINTDFTEVQSIDLIYDSIPNRNYSNSFFVDSTDNPGDIVRTINWSEPYNPGALFWRMAEWLLIDHFNLSNKARYKIDGVFLRPKNFELDLIDLYIDSNNFPGIEFVVNGYEYNVKRCTYKLELWQWLRFDGAEIFTG